MSFTVHYRRADAQGTKTFLTGLNRAAAEAAQAHFFDTHPEATMCWVLDDAGNMLGDALTRDPAPV